MLPSWSRSGNFSLSIATQRIVTALEGVWAPKSTNKNGDSINYGDMMEIFHVQNMCVYYYYIYIYVYIYTYICMFFREDIEGGWLNLAIHEDLP
jgi:hypothetical protein